MRIADVAMTGEWEKELARIERGNCPPTPSERKKGANHGGNLRPTAATSLFGSRDPASALSQVWQRAGCGSTAGVRDNTECGLPVFRLKAGRTLSDDEIKDLLTEGHTKLLKGFKSKQGKSFDAVVAFDGEYNTTLCSRRLKGAKKFSGRKK